MLINEAAFTLQIDVPNSDLMRPPINSHTYISNTVPVKQHKCQSRATTQRYIILFIYILRYKPPGPMFFFFSLSSVQSKNDFTTSRSLADSDLFLVFKYFL